MIFPFISELVAGTSIMLRGYAAACLWCCGRVSQLYTIAAPSVRGGSRMLRENVVYSM